jgi:hypothetical protein
MIRFKDIDGIPPVLGSRYIRMIINNLLSYFSLMHLSALLKFKGSIFNMVAG